MSISSIINLTQHTATPEQVSQGVVEPENKRQVQLLLTFDTLPTQREIEARAIALADIAEDSGCDAAMIGGAPYLMSALESELRSALDRMLGLMYYGLGDEAIADAMYDVLIRNHRTVQQRFVSNIVAVLMRYADSHHDLRNEAAVRLCREIRDAVEQSRYWGPRGLPYY